MKVSVIVPVYNGEEHLRQCMDSICRQTLKDIEIICVDDGSSDTSFAILQEYQAKDPRIQLYQQANRYAGAARNLGKKNASGEYLVFWDCDDYFELDALEIMYRKAVSVKADICVCGANQFWDAKGKFVPAVADYMNRRKVPADVFNRESNKQYILNFTTAAPWNKMFRRAFIEQIGLDFQEIRNGNDVYFTVNALCQAERITTVRQPLVTYRINQSASLTGTAAKAPMAPIQAWTSAAENLERLHIMPERSFANRAVSNVIYLLRNIKEYRAFEEAAVCLKEEALKKMHVTVREDGYYYVKWHGECVRHILNDTPEELLIYLANTTYMQMRESNMEKQAAQSKVKKLLKNCYYKSGSAMVRIQGMLKEGLKSTK